MKAHASFQVPNWRIDETPGDDSVVTSYPQKLTLLMLFPLMKVLPVPPGGGITQGLPARPVETCSTWPMLEWFSTLCQEGVST